MTVITNSYDATVINNIIRENRNTTIPSQPQPSQSKLRYFSLKDNLDDLREDLIKFTVSNYLSIKSWEDLGERYTDTLDEFLEEYEESDGLTGEKLRALLNEAYEEGVRQRAIKEKERWRECAVLTYTGLCSYVRIHPEISFDEYMNSSKITFHSRFRYESKLTEAQTAQLIQDAIAQKPFVYPEESETKSTTVEPQPDPEPEPQSYTTEELVAQWKLEHPQSEPPPVVEEPTSEPEALQTPVIDVVAPQRPSEKKLDYMRTCNAHWMERLATLPYSARWLAMVIVYYAGKDPHHVAVLSHQHMERFGLDKNTTRRALKELEDAAIVTVIRNNHSSPRALLSSEAFPSK